MAGKVTLKKSSSAPTAEAAVDDPVQTVRAAIPCESPHSVPSHFARGQKADTAPDDVADQGVEEATRKPEERTRCRFERHAAERRDDGRRSLGGDIGKRCPGPRPLDEHPQSLAAIEGPDEYR